MTTVFAGTYYFNPRDAAHGHGLNEALTGDRHFVQAGFIALLKSSLHFYNFAVPSQLTALP